jgi:hypothetical protein
MLPGLGDPPTEFDDDGEHLPCGCCMRGSPRAKHLSRRHIKFSGNRSEEGSGFFLNAPQYVDYCLRRKVKEFGAWHPGCIWRLVWCRSKATGRNARAALDRGPKFHGNILDQKLFSFRLNWFANAEPVEIGRPKVLGQSSG